MRIIGVQTKTVPTQAVLVTFVEGNLTRLIRNGKKEQLEIGVGKKKDIDRRKLALVARQIVRSAKEHKIKHLAISFSDFLLGFVAFRSRLAWLGLCHPTGGFLLSCRISNSARVR